MFRRLPPPRRDDAEREARRTRNVSLFAGKNRPIRAPTNSENIQRSSLCPSFTPHDRELPRNVTTVSSSFSFHCNGAKRKIRAAER
ncbi:hypothetical protein CSUB01_06121 [Colletotrichum sublineola]|uniref:Uncharacterized protein n=1 Tax=Colletotrichum sublineola TaxID=1173701 RepID=A0A066XAM9_COLSU|nr:hypothetical protein CSUB01_06121 [Colletotrichum sublineola]